MEETEIYKKKYSVKRAREKLDSNRFYLTYFVFIFFVQKKYITK